MSLVLLYPGAEDDEVEDVTPTVEADDKGAGGKTLAESALLLDEYFGDDQLSVALQRGYERGQAYQNDLLERFPSQERRLIATARNMDRLNRNDLE